MYFPKGKFRKNRAKSDAVLFLPIRQKKVTLHRKNIKKMKYLTTLCGFIAAFLCLAQSANAQYLPSQIHREKDHFVNESGAILSDKELVDAVGEDVFHETVVGARKQYKTGQKLFVSGLAGIGVGVAGIVGGTALVAAAGPHQANDEIYFDNEDLAMTGALVLTLGTVAAALGGTALTVGIPFKAIGQSRLNWVENDYNERHAASLHLGATPSGVGFALKF